MLKSHAVSAPPSSSGLGRSPLKAQTGVRVPLGAQINRLNKAVFFHYSIFLELFKLLMVDNSVR